MKESKTKYAIRIVAGTFLLVLAVSAYVGGFTILKFTFVKWWIPFGIAFGIAAVSGLTLQRIWHWLTNSYSFILNYICHIAIITGILFAGSLVINYFGPDRLPSRPGKAVVSKVYREQHYRTRRVSRRVYTRGAPYWVYRANITLDDGNNATINLTKKRYETLHKGDTLGVVVKVGFFGWEEIRTDSISYPPVRTKKSKRPRYRRSYSDIGSKSGSEGIVSGF